MMEKLKNSAKTQLINIAFNAFLETQFLKASDVWLTLKKKRRYNTNLSSRCIHRCIYIKDNTIRGISIHTCLLTLYLFLLGFTENIRHLIWRLVTLICNMCDSHSHQVFQHPVLLLKTTVAIYRHLFDESLFFTAMSM